jgi:hypothetical protein
MARSHGISRLGGEVVFMPEPTDNPTFRRSEEFETLYANNVGFESSSVWDLKMVLGNLDQSVNPNVIEQHTAVILPWQQARLTAYYLTVNFLAYEATNGRMASPSRITPQRPNPDDPSLDEIGKKLVAYLAWIHDQFFGSNPYIPRMKPPRLLSQIPQLRRLSMQH